MITPAPQPADILQGLAVLVVQHANLRAELRQRDERISAMFEMLLQERQQLLQFLQQINGLIPVLRIDEQQSGVDSGRIPEQPCDGTPGGPALERLPQ